jgi:hypothetical protein
VFAILFAALAMLPQPSGVVVERVDRIEINHCFNEAAVHQYDQIIVWHWYGDDYHVRDWAILKDGATCQPDGNGGAWALFPDRRFFRPRLHSVSARAYCETWTCFDPEAIDREALPESKRVLLGGVQP